MATTLAIMSATSNTPTFIEHAKIGVVRDDWQTRSPLAALLVTGETVMLATVGNRGSALFTSQRLLVAEEAGILTKRPLVKAIRRGAIDAYVIDRDETVTLALRGGGFGTAVLEFEDEGFDPMLLTAWLGETLTGAHIEKAH